MSAEVWSAETEPPPGIPDAVVFVFDSSPDALEANVAALDLTERRIAAREGSLDLLPHVMQYNKRDLPIVLPVCEMRAALNRYGADEVEAAAKRGRGVLTTAVAAVHALSPRRSSPALMRLRAV
jgi:hypothetical protein